MHEGQTLITFIWPAQNPELMQQLAARKVTVLAIDALPRMLSRAQKMDALTSQAGVAGYRAVIEAANAFGRFFNGQITAAGKVPPAKVFIAGAGVAGLAAIGTAAGLGAIVRANDTRAEVADQVVSLGGEFVKVDYEEEGSGGGGYAKVMSEGFQQAQREMYAKQAREVDIIITTALIPGKPAPRLITAEMVKSMKPGSVIVDMAAERGGNCELTEPGKAVVKHGVTIVGYTDLTVRLAKQSSTLYATNLFRLTEELCKTKDGVINVNMDDDAIRGLTVIKEGNITWPPPPLKLPAAACGQARGDAGQGAQAWRGERAGLGHAHCGHVRHRGAGCSGSSAPTRRRPSSATSPCSCWQYSSVTWWCGTSRPALHTPLMSVTNAISSIIAIGALVQIAPPLLGGAAARPEAWIRWLACGGHRAHRDQHVRRFRRHAAHAADVPQITETIHVRNSRNCLLYRSDHTLHPQPRRPVQSGDLAARQSLRHDRHDHRRAGDGFRAARHVGRLCLDHRRDGGRRQHRSVRLARRENDPDAGTGGADAQPGRPRRDAGRLCQLHRSRRPRPNSPVPRSRSTKWKSTSAS